MEYKPPLYLSVNNRNLYSFVSSQERNGIISHYNDID